MRVLLACVLLLCASNLSAQSQDTVGVQTVDLDIFEKVEVAARVDAALWKRHLEQHLLPVIENAAKKGMKAGTYIVYVRFLVEKNGSIGNVKALNDPGFGLAKGAEKVLKTGPRWTPGSQNGRVVRSYHTQPITFVITEE